MDVVADRVQFLSRGQGPQAPEAAAGASAKVPEARTAAAAARGAGGWGVLAAKQLHDDDGADDTDLKVEGFEEIPV